MTRRIRQVAGGRAWREELAVLIYTSGTSGSPRGAMLSHRAMLANLEQVAAIEPTPVTERDVVLLVLPLFHIYGLNVGLGMQVWAGATGVLVERFEPVGCLELMAAEAVSMLAGAPPMFVMWSRGDPAQLRRASPTSASRCRVRRRSRPVRSPPSRDITGLGVHEGYGLTETAPVLTSTLVTGRPKPGSIGRPVPGVELGAVGRRGQPWIRTRTPGRSWSAGRTSSPATGRTVRTGPMPRAGSPPATSASWTTTGTCISSTGSRT
ncbi:MAG: AMP-binding protein [Geodermatophilaceae bacterium]